MQNRIRALREKLGLTQGALAQLIGTSQQQIARIETGNQSVKLDTALAISAILKKDLAQVFPSTRSLLGKGKSKRDRGELVRLHYNSKAVADFASAGVDLDPATWIVHLRLRGQTELAFTVSKHDINRLNSFVKSVDSVGGFFVFHSDAVAVALNPHHLLHFHTLWDGSTPSDWRDPSVSVDEISVFLSDSTEPLQFDVDPDEGLPDDEDDEGQLRSLLFVLETGDEDDAYVDFLDVDGERAYFRASEIAAVVVPLWALDRRLADLMQEAAGSEGELALPDDKESGAALRKRQVPADPATPLTSPVRHD